MEFNTAKTVLMLALPPASLFIAIIAGVLVLAFCRCFGRFLIITGLLLLYLLSISPVSGAIVKPLERGLPTRLPARTEADAIVVLGGGVRDESWLGLPAEPSCSSLERVVKGVRVYRALPLSFVLMGGNGDPSREVMSDADAMAPVARELGVPGKSIIIENKSKNTLQSSRALKNVIKGRRIILITSAFHLKRASGMFRKQGFSVIPLPSGHLYEQRPLTLYSFIPQAHELVSSSIAISEYASLFWFSIRGEI